MSATEKDADAPAVAGASAVLETVPETVVTELERLDPEFATVTLSDGTVVKLSPLKLRQFLKLMRIVTRGGSNVLSTVALNFTGDAEAFATSLIAVVLFAIPEAEDETVEFLRSMVVPVNPADAEKVNALLEDPELDDAVTIVEAVVRREAPDLKALGSRLGKMFQTAQKMGAAPTT